MRLHPQHILMPMRTTVNIDAALLEKATRLTGIGSKSDLVRRGLEVLVELESAKRLALLGGSEKGIRPILRRITRS